MAEHQDIEILDEGQGAGATSSQQLSAVILEAVDQSCDFHTLDQAAHLATRVHPLIVQLVKELGKDSDITLQASTAVGCRLLDITIAAVNAASTKYAPLINSCKHNRAAYINSLKHQLDESTKVIDYLKHMPLSDAFREERMVPEEAKLTALRQRLAILQAQNEDTPPESKHYTVKEEPRKKHWGVIACICLITLAVGYYFYDMYQERTSFEKISETFSEEDIMAYLNDGSNTHYINEATELYLSNMDSILLDPVLMSQPNQYPPLVRMYNFATTTPLPEQVRDAILTRIKARTDSLYSIALTADDINAWHMYQAQAPSEYLYGSSTRLDSLETIAWSQEPSAWSLASDADERDYYERYLSEYPDGAHATDADGKLIDLEVNAYRNRGQAFIDNIDWIADNNGPGSRVVIFNQTDYDMEFLFSGPSSRRMHVEPQGHNSMNLADGDYRILVLVNHGTDQKFSFTQTFEHGLYSSTLSIKD